MGEAQHKQDGLLHARGVHIRHLGAAGSGNPVQLSASDAPFRSSFQKEDT